MDEPLGGQSCNRGGRPMSEALRSGFEFENYWDGGGLSTSE